MKPILVSMILLCGTLLATGQPISVPGDSATIQAAINAAKPGDTVLVSEGTYYENINFRGKAITVASLFLLDGDSSHISRTIIDGSQPTDPDNASVVTFNSREDTTSILMGFTITGGKGTRLPNWPDAGWKTVVGGGIHLMYSGGKIQDNVIEHIHIAGTGSEILGGAVQAHVTGGHTVILRGNVIRNNSASSTEEHVLGAGVFLTGGSFLVEGNTFAYDTARAAKYSAGGGLFYWAGPSNDFVDEVVIRNNTFFGNAVFSDREGSAIGAALGLEAYTRDSRIQVYNNLICENYSNQQGGGVYFYLCRASVYNNTLVDNYAGQEGHSLLFWDSNDLILFNNIIWSPGEDTISQHTYRGNAATNRIIARYNVLKQPFGADEPVSSRNNTYMDPGFTGDGYELGPESPVIGRGIDWMIINDTLYSAPVRDLAGNARPGTIDAHVDPGALESAYPRLNNANADLAYFGMAGHDLIPGFHRDTLEYLLSKRPEEPYPQAMKVFPADRLAILEIDTAGDISSMEEADRTYTLSVTSSDSSTQKTYRVLYRYLSPDASLSSLEADLGRLEPDFDPETLQYVDTLPYLTLTVPLVSYTTTDAHATVVVKEAERLWSSFEEARTTEISVTSDNLQNSRSYKILFTPDPTRPVVRLVKDTVDMATESIGAHSNESGMIFLVPVGTDATWDSIQEYQLASMEAPTAGDTVWMPATDLDPGEYWIYATDRFHSVSDNEKVVIISTVGMGSPKDIGFRIYPNPVEDVLYIETGSEISSLELFNVLGVRVWSGDPSTGRIGMGQLSPGVYYLRIKTLGEGPVTLKLMKR